jgi:hypothetical protein
MDNWQWLRLALSIVNYQLLIVFPLFGCSIDHAFEQCHECIFFLDLDNVKTDFILRLSSVAWAVM